MILKLAVFYIVNSYASLFYVAVSTALSLECSNVSIAFHFAVHQGPCHALICMIAVLSPVFVQSHVVIDGQQQECNRNAANEPDCMLELQQQLAILMLTRFVS